MLRAGYLPVGVEDLAFGGEVLRARKDQGPGPYASEGPREIIAAPEAEEKGMLAPAGYFLGAVAPLALELLREGLGEIADELVIELPDFALALREERAL
jgi:hypothetical protein